MEADDITRLMPTSVISLEEPPEAKDACIEFVLDRIVDAGRVTDRDAALEALLQRETETTTGVGMGIAIPHAKTDAVEEPTVAFVRSDAGIDFESMDEEPAHLIFMILVPESGAEEHLGILSSLSRALMHDEVRESLYDAEDEADVQQTMREAIA